MNRTIDERLLMDLADQIGLPKTPAQPSPSGPDLPREAKAVFESMKVKSDSELLTEIMKVKAQLQKQPGAYEKQIRAVKALRGMMNPEQRQRLDQILHLLGERP